jgi:hypothetical protein
MKERVNVVIHVDFNKVIDKLKGDDFYRNMFETGTSSGSLSEDFRIQWEDTLFNRLYHDAKPEERVKYGAVNITANKTGVTAAYGYGKSFFVLKPAIKKRTTFVYGDSSMQDVHIATFDHFSNILYYVPEDTLVGMVSIANGYPIRTIVQPPVYIEAHIHGPVRFDTDVESIVINTNYDESVMSAINQFAYYNKIKVLL